jgi:GTP-binding protein Era
MKVGFVNIFGKPNAGKSTLLNAIMGEKMAIVSSKVQTTRHRIKAFLNKEDEYQIIFSDTPGIIDPKYKLHEKMMGAVKSALEDADLGLLMVDVRDDFEEIDAMFTALRLKVPCIVVMNKSDLAEGGRVKEANAYFSKKPYCSKIISISALNISDIERLLKVILELIPEGGHPFFDQSDLSDLPTKFFVSEIIREKIYQLFGEEIPYHTAVLVNSFKEQPLLVKIQADIVVNRESQKAIIIGEKGKLIKEIGTLARKDIEAFIGSKVYLELLVKVKPKWRDNELKLREFGYQ